MIKTLPTNSRFFHCEYFRLREDKKGLGKKGDIIGLEVNMRSPGGPTPDMMNFSSDMDVFKIWANMVCFDEARMACDDKKYYVVYAARRKVREYKRTPEEINALYPTQIVMNQAVSEVLAGAMGDWMVIARFENKEDMLPFVQCVQELA